MLVRRHGGYRQHPTQSAFSPSSKIFTKNGKSWTSPACRSRFGVKAVILGEESGLGGAKRVLVEKYVESGGTGTLEGCYYDFCLTRTKARAYNIGEDEIGETYGQANRHGVYGAADDEHRGF